MRDLSNYALCARSRVQLGRRLTLNAVVEAPDTHQLVQRLNELRQPAAAADPGPAAGAEPAPGSPGAAGAASRAGGAGAPQPLEPCTAHATLRCAMPGHDLTATAGYNLQYLDSSGDVAHVPLAVSLDLSSHDRADGLQYRVGLHQVGRGKKPGACSLRAAVLCWGAVSTCLRVEGACHAAVRLATRAVLCGSTQYFPLPPCAPRR